MPVFAAIQAATATSVPMPAALKAAMGNISESVMCNASVVMSPRDSFQRAA
ncbi:MAG: hypothetical protein HC888_15730 [Candidatus Competibacteraceae bacterium]|nr:hypothetical protein [Candidatus Competibacteraceae bacterium]